MAQTQWNFKFVCLASDGRLQFESKEGSILRVDYENPLAMDINSYRPQDLLHFDDVMRIVKLSRTQLFYASRTSRYISRRVNENRKNEGQAFPIWQFQKDTKKLFEVMKKYWQPHGGTQLYKCVVRYDSILGKSIEDYILEDGDINYVIAMFEEESKAA
jgi:hypothetical protein